MTTATVQDVQRYWDARPCNLRHSTAEVGSRQYFHEVEARKCFVEPHIPAFADFGRRKGKYFRWMPPALFRWFEHRAGWHTLIKATLPAR
jgi:hypothetical protein